MGGLDASMEDLSMFTKEQLKKIALIRILCSNADIYLLDHPFHHLSTEFSFILEDELEKKQKNERKTIVMVENDLDQTKKDDYVMFVQKGKIEEFGKYEDLVKN